MIKTKKTDAGEQLVFVGTDSFRLSEYKVPQSLNSDFSLIIPKSLINDLKSVLNFAISKDSPDIKINHSENLIAFSFMIDEIKIITTSLLIQGNFPDYDREEVMPTNFEVSIMLDKNECEKAIKKI